MERIELTFTSGGERCAAWHYRPAAAPGTAGGAGAPCVVMAHGFSLTRHDGLAPYAEALASAGAAVLVFDHRNLGDSGGELRQRFRIAEQREDWEAAVRFARGLDGVDPARIVLWGYSFSGGHAVQTAAADPEVAGVLLLCPFLDGLARVRATPLRIVPWIMPLAALDVAGVHNLVPVTGEPGTRAAMNLPGEAAGFAASAADGSPWRNEISPGVFLTVALHRPVRKARKVRCPVWVGLGEQDVSVSAKAVERFAGRAPDAELHRYPYDHFGPLHGEGPARIAADQAAFLRRRLL